MARRPKIQKIQKTLHQKLTDLDDHLFIVREHLHRLNEGTAHLKVLAAELRTLVCLSSGTEGLLWRLAGELKVPDEIHLHHAGSIDVDHPLSRGLKFAVVPLQRAGLGDPKLLPAYYSFRHIIKESEAVFISGKGLTHEYLIKAVSQQMGTAHEDEGIEYALDDLGQIFFNGVEPYVSILAIDADLILEIGERILEVAKKEVAYQRKKRPNEVGHVTIIVRLGLRQIPAGRLLILRFKSYISDVEIACYAGPQSIVFSLVKRGSLIHEVYAKYPHRWPLDTDAVFAFEYSSNEKKVHTITNGDSQDKGIDCDLGWLNAKELSLVEIPEGTKDVVYRQFVLLYQKLIKSQECLEILNLPPDGYGLWKYNDEIESDELFG